MRRVDGAHIAKLLGHDQVRLQRLEQLLVDAVDTFAARRMLRDDAVDFGRGEIMRQHGTYELWLVLRILRVVALEGDSGYGVAQAERVQDLGGGGKQGTDAHGELSGHRTWGVPLLAIRDPGSALLPGALCGACLLGSGRGGSRGHAGLFLIRDELATGLFDDVRCGGECVGLRAGVGVRSQDFKASKVRPQKIAGVRLGHRGQLLRRAMPDHAATELAAFGAHIDQVVGIADNVQIVFDDDDRIAEIGKPMKHVKQAAHIVKVKPGGGLVKQVQGAAGLAFRKLAGKLHALGLTARKRGRGLAQMDVAKADVDQRLQLNANRRNVFQDGQGVGDGKLEQVGDRVAVEANLQRLLVVTATVTNLAEHVDVGQEIHLDAALAFALAGLAAAALHVEGEASGLIARARGLREAARKDRGWRRRRRCRWPGLSAGSGRWGTGRSG